MIFIYFVPVSCSVQSWWGSSGISSTCTLSLLQSSFYHRSTVRWASRWRRTNTLYVNGLQMSIKLADYLRILLIMLILPITSCLCFVSPHSEPFFSSTEVYHVIVVYQNQDLSLCPYVRWTKQSIPLVNPTAEHLELLVSNTNPRNYTVEMDSGNVVSSHNRTVSWLCCVLSTHPLFLDFFPNLIAPVRICSWFNLASLSEHDIDSRVIQIMQLFFNPHCLQKAFLCVSARSGASLLHSRCCPFQTLFHWRGEAFVKNYFFMPSGA